MLKVSIVIPAYNEEAFIGALLEIILKIDLSPIGFEREIIVVDNGSEDKTFEIASAFPGVRCLRIEKNRGKGEGTKYGISQATGDYILIQDADLEYDPQDYIPLLSPLREVDRPTAIYGSRIKGEERQGFFRGKHPEKSVAIWVANELLTFWVWLLFGKHITDTLTGYKVYPSALLQKFTIETKGFETDHELTAKLIRSGVLIQEVPSRYYPRSVEEGKKIRSADFFIAVWTFLKYRFVTQGKF